MWRWTIPTAILLAAGLIPAIVSACLRRRRYASVCRRWRAACPADRLDALRGMVENTDPNAPAWYLLGCAYLRENKTKQAARAFGIAHHADCNLETAALLTFACLKAREGESATDIIKQAVDTWDELKRPDLTRRWEDRLMLECLQATTRDAPELSPLGHLIWLVVSPAQQSRLECLLESRDGNWADALRVAHPP